MIAASVKRLQQNIDGRLTNLENDPASCRLFGLAFLCVLVAAGVLGGYPFLALFALNQALYRRALALRAVTLRPTAKPSATVASIFANIEHMALVEVAAERDQLAGRVAALKTERDTLVRMLNEAQAVQAATRANLAAECGQCVELRSARGKARRFECTGRGRACGSKLQHFQLVIDQPEAGDAFTRGDLSL